MMNAQKLLVSTVVMLFALGACPWLPTANGQDDMRALAGQLANQAKRIKQLEARQGLAVTNPELEDNTRS